MLAPFTRNIAIMLPMSSDVFDDTFARVFDTSGRLRHGSAAGE
jgi:hypothetical protein